MANKIKCMNILKEYAIIITVYVLKLRNHKRRRMYGKQLVSFSASHSMTSQRIWNPNFEVGNIGECLKTSTNYAQTFIAAITSQTFSLNQRLNCNRGRTVSLILFLAFFWFCRTFLSKLFLAFFGSTAPFRPYSSKPFFDSAAPFRPYSFLVCRAVLSYSQRG